MSIPAARTSGSTIGNTINTIGTHSSGQPKTKISRSMAINSSMGGSDRLVSKLARKSALPRRENTAPNKLEETTSIKIMLETSSA